MYTVKQKQHIRGQYPYWKLRFRKDGTIEAQRHPGGAWGRLYTPEDAKRHLKAKGLWRHRYGLDAGRLITIDGQPVFHLSWTTQLTDGQRYPLPPSELDAIAHHVVKLLNQNPHRFV